MIRDKLILSVGFDAESSVWNVSVSVMGVEVWLACFSSIDAADRFINAFVYKIREESLHFSEYEIVPVIL